MNTTNFELSNSLKNNLDKQLKINNEIIGLPKGHINTLYRNGKGYYYLTYRNGYKICNEYLGPVGKVDLSDILEKLNQRLKLKKELSELKKEETRINKLIKKVNDTSQK